MSMQRNQALTEGADLCLQLTVPLDPVMWYKPKRALGGPGDISIPSMAAEGFLDFEGELCIVLSRDARDVKVEDASDYILGFTIGNDLTARSYQDPKRSGGQFTRCKAFDGFAPLGPILTNKKTFGALEDKRIVTKVNGRVFQDSPCDMIHSPEVLISFLSQGTTLPAGTVIMTGSPPGIGYFQNPKYSLRDGDIVEPDENSPVTLVKLSYRWPLPQGSVAMMTPAVMLK
ncbi:fumarylacetoacetate hydrolase family [Fusarium pseudocircinatum]|uniref:Fumarylacetoacetate hydrolase family n=1 Tax=Fusarium pseudocircinatum TaxID=56676 RepID=A0A8H5LFE8_9HYPO|nr:fumarylacetoacetate hydrolase family [Fusarium pseudocircinatum]